MLMLQHSTDSAIYPSHLSSCIRLLLNAAQLGQVAKAEQIIAQMFDADLTPGPRAFHVLVFAYVRGKNPKDALAVARRASDEGERRDSGRRQPLASKGGGASLRVLLTNLP